MQLLLFQQSCPLLAPHILNSWMPLGLWCMIPSLTLASRMKSCLFLLRNLCKNHSLDYKFFNKGFKPGSSPSICCSASRDWVLPTYLSAGMPPNSFSALCCGRKATLDAPWWFLTERYVSMGSQWTHYCASYGLQQLWLEKSRSRRALGLWLCCFSWWNTYQLEGGHAFCNAVFKWSR